MMRGFGIFLGHVSEGRFAIRPPGRYPSPMRNGLLLLALGTLAGCQSFHEGPEGVNYDVWSYGDVWSPSFTAILSKDGKLIQVIAGEGGVGQISTGAGIAIGAALIDNDGDTNVSGTGQGGSSAASAVSGATINNGG